MSGTLAAVGLLMLIGLAFAAVAGAPSLARSHYTFALEQLRWKVSDALYERTLPAHDPAAAALYERLDRTRHRRGPETMTAVLVFSRWAARHPEHTARPAPGPMEPAAASLLADLLAREEHLRTRRALTGSWLGWACALVLTVPAARPRLQRRVHLGLAALDAYAASDNATDSEDIGANLDTADSRIRTRVR